MTDTILVSIVHNPPDDAVLLIGRKPPNSTVQIINAFRGEEALDLYQKLIAVDKPSK